jgi:hypothetical protein
VLPLDRHGISPLEAFGDALFAFGLTLLVSLDLPASYDDLMRLMAGRAPVHA